MEITAVQEVEVPGMQQPEMAVQETHQAPLPLKAVMAAMEVQALRIMVLAVVVVHRLLEQTELQLRAVMEALVRPHLLQAHQ
jgi:hypothetical protein